jgi:hypothetical protein
MRKLLTLLAILAVACLVFAPTSAFAAKKHFRVTVSIHFARGSNFDAFSGTVKSKKSKCVKKRPVKLFRKTSGNDKKVATDRSDRHGDWQVKIPYPGARQGTYYAKVPKKKTKRFVCDKARSGSLLVPGQ